MNRKIVIRADGNSVIGMGHITRCLALGDMLRNDYSITFATCEPTEEVKNAIHTLTHSIISLPVFSDPASDVKNLLKHLSGGEIVILDGYTFKTEYQKALKEKGCKVVAIDDLNAWHQVADAVINHAEGIAEEQYDLEKYTEPCLGLRYAMLRKPFLGKAQKKTISSVKKIFVSMGAADLPNNTSKFSRVLKELSFAEEINIMLGSGSKHLEEVKTICASDKRFRLHVDITADKVAGLISGSDLAICPASSIAIECCAMGIGLISGTSADNQSGMLRGFINKNVLFSLGDLNTANPETIKNAVTRVSENIPLLNEQVSQQAILIDGRSPERFRALFRRIQLLPLKFRFAEEKDAEQYFKWVNEPEVRKNSFNQSAIAWEDHKKWFGSRIHNPDFAFYFFETSDGIAAGQVRIEKSGDETVVDISVDPALRGLSLGSSLLDIACTDYLGRFPGSKIISYVKKENPASYAIFKKVNFVDSENVPMHGTIVHKLSRQGK